MVLCGGSASGFNAKVLATLCNLPEVRTGLLKHHIFIPEETVFIAAEHCTTIDELEWIYVPELSKEAEESYILLKNTIPEVSRKANELRLTQLPGIHYDKKNATKEAKKISSDWSEVRPEWGLARNASFIIGQRKLTEKRQLNGRSFLHNYDWRKDPRWRFIEYYFDRACDCFPMDKFTILCFNGCSTLLWKWQ